MQTEETYQEVKELAKTDDISDANEYLKLGWRLFENLFSKGGNRRRIRRLRLWMGACR